MAFKCKKGIYIPQFPEKWVITESFSSTKPEIVYRSGWEKLFCIFIDNNSNIIKANSEGMKIKYNNPVTGKVSTYYMDFMMETKDGKIWLIEIKPKAQRFPPKPPRKNAKNPQKAQQNYLKAVETYAINQAKWEAAELLCKENGWIFKIIDETHLFPK